MATKLLIVDDHGVLRAGLKVLLDMEPAFTVVGEASSGEEAVQQAKTLRPDVILMDLSMAGMGGLAATRELKESLPSAHVLVLTVHEDRSLLKEAIRAGASGYILKRAVKAELLQAIHAVVRGELYVHPAMVQALIEDPTPQDDVSDEVPPQVLTEREIDVLRLVVQGYTNHQVGNLLNLSSRTVEYHRANIMGKLNLRSRVELVRYAAQNGLFGASSSL